MANYINKIKHTVWYHITWLCIRQRGAAEPGSEGKTQPWTKYYTQSTH